jgi:alpha-L-arabinofuranosidase
MPPYWTTRCAAWVEYCNGAADTKWGAERAKNGHPEPFGVKYWFVGNETFGPGEIGRMSPTKYCDVYKTFANAMQAVDPAIELFAVGNLFPNIARLKNVGKEINRQVLKGISAEMEYLSVHQYVPDFTLNTMLRYWVLQRHGSPSRKTHAPANHLLRKEGDTWHVYDMVSQMAGI